MAEQNAPNLLMSLGKVPAFLAEHFGYSFVRQTVFGWVRNGIKGEKLRVAQTPAGMKTTREWVLDFLARVEVKG